MNLAKNFKVGDKVVVKDDIENTSLYVDGMKHLKGNVYTIDSVLGGSYRLMGEGRGWAVDDSMLSLHVESVKIDKPTIPHYVAKYIKDISVEEFPTWIRNWERESGIIVGADVEYWIENNKVDTINAILHGYKVEGHDGDMYHIVVGKNRGEGKSPEYFVFNKDGELSVNNGSFLGDPYYLFTTEEIDNDYIKYWDFAENVKEISL